MTRVKISDLIIAFFVLICAASLFVMIPADYDKSRVIVKTPNAEYVFPLEYNEVYRVTGANGETVIEVKDRKVRVLESECPNKICVKQGFASAIVCLPNRVEVYTNGDSSKKLDAVSK